MPISDKTHFEDDTASGEPVINSMLDIMDTLKAGFAELSPQLQRAARYVIDNPGDIAVHSMRSIARKAGVQHNAMVRLAQGCGFDGYDQFRSHFQDSVKRDPDENWLDRAKSIHDKFPVGGENQMTAAYFSQSVENLKQTFQNVTEYQVREAVSHLQRARRIYVLGVRSMFPLAYYFHYTYRMFDSRSVLLTGLGGAFADDLRSMEKADVMLVFSYHPYAQDTVMAVDFARERGAKLIAVTDSVKSPVIAEGGVNFIVSNESLPLFPSLVPALSLAELLVTMALSDGGDAAMDLIKNTQRQLEKFGVYFPPSNTI